MKLAALASVVALLLIGAAYLLYCLAMMFCNTTRGRLRFAALLPLALVDESLFNEKGNTYRKRALIVVAIAIVLVGVFVVVLGCT